MQKASSSIAFSQSPHQEILAIAHSRIQAIPNTS